MPILLSQLVMKPVLWTMGVLNGVLVVGACVYFLFFSSGGVHVAAIFAARF
jgi:hypothetical protein